MEYNPKEDAEFFGEDTWIYCDQHMRPHTTGWCTVSLRNKTALNSKTYEDAVIECRAKNFELYSDFKLNK